MLFLPWTSFYDDYSLVTTQEDCRSAQACTFLFFQALGWKIAHDGTKAEPFADTFRALGVVFDFRLAPRGRMSLSNTPERGQEVLTWCRSLLGKQTFTPQECHVFASRIRWLESQTHGRTGRLAVRVILTHGSLDFSRKARPLTPQLLWAIRWLLCFVPQAKPRVFGGDKPRHWHVFTDGAVEDSFSGLGGVLCNEQGVPISKFGIRVPDQVLQDWHRSGTQHPVFQAELLAVLVALQVWRRALTGCLVTFWLDNEAVRFALAKGTAFPQSNARMVHSFLQLETALSVHSWFSRVPSECNPADEPSRLLPGSAQAQQEPSAFLRGVQQQEIDVGQVVSLALRRIRRSDLGNSPILLSSLFHRPAGIVQFLTSPTGQDSQAVRTGCERRNCPTLENRAERCINP